MTRQIRRGEQEGELDEEEKKLKALMVDYKAATGKEWQQPLRMSRFDKVSSNANSATYLFISL